MSAFEETLISELRTGRDEWEQRLAEVHVDKE